MVYDSLMSYEEYMVSLDAAGNMHDMLEVVINIKQSMHCHCESTIIDGSFENQVN